MYRVRDTQRVNDEGLRKKIKQARPIQLHRYGLESWRPFFLENIPGNPRMSVPDSQVISLF